jgi:hypothetical protein
LLCHGVIAVAEEADVVVIIHVRRAAQIGEVGGDSQRRLALAMYAGLITETVIQPKPVIAATGRGQLFLFPDRILLHIRENGFAGLGADDIATPYLRG